MATAIVLALSGAIQPRTVMAEQLTLGQPQSVVQVQSTPDTVELVAEAQNGVVYVAQGTAVIFNLRLYLSPSENVDSTVKVYTNYYLNGQGNGDGNIPPDTLSAPYPLKKNAEVIVPVTVTVSKNYQLGDINVPIAVEITNGGKKNTAEVINSFIDNFKVHVTSGDLIAPVVTISSPLNNGYYNAAALPLSPVFSVLEANQYSTRIDGWQTSEGTHTVIVTATDEAGNVGSARATYTVDNTVPTISTTITNGGVYNEATLKNMGQYYEVQDANPASESASPLEYTEGNHTAVVTAVDKAGNKSEVTINYIVDNTAPVITFNFKDGGYYQSRFLLNLSCYYNVEDLNPGQVNASSLDLSEGSHSVTVSASDLAGNSSSSTASYIVDDTAPAISFLLDPLKFYNMLTLGEIGKYYTAEDINMESVTADTLEMNVDGTYEATVTAVDKAGNILTKSITYNVDNTKPVITFNEKLHNGGFYKSSFLNSIKADFYTAEDAHLGIVTASSSELDLTEGEHTISVTAIDLAGNEATESITYIIDDTAPEISFNIEENSFLTTKNLLEALGDKNYYNASDANGVTSLIADSLELTDGTYTLRVTAGDAAGNETSKTITFTLDNIEPVVTMKLDESKYYNEKALTELGQYYLAEDINLDKVEASTLEMKIDGTYSATVTAVDKAGNSTTKTVNYTVDNTKPVITLVEPLNNNGFYRSNSLEAIKSSFFTAADEHMASLPSYELDLTEGPHQITIIASDLAGNETVMTLTYTIDNTAPVVTFDNLKEGQRFIVGQIINVNWNAFDDNLATQESGIITLDTITPGVKHITIPAAVDKAGNATPEQVITYYVYGYSGLLQPINLDGKGSFKQGSTIPVKFQLMDGTKSLADAKATIQLIRVSTALIVPENQVVSTSTATEGNLFRYDSTANQYIFNLGTKLLIEGQYQAIITITVDGTTVTKTSQSFTIRK